MSEWYVNPVGGYGVTGALALVLVLVLTLVGPPRNRLSPRRRAALAALRFLVVALAIIALLRPALVETTTKNQSATLVLLVDRSRSMSIADAVGGKSRWELLHSAMDDALPTLSQLDDEVEIKVYAFDSDLRSVEFADGKLDLESVPEGEQTAIGAALAGVLEREAGKRLLGVILVSDGAQRAYAPHDLAPQGPARRMGALGFPLYTLAMGQPRGVGQSRDLAIRDLSVNQSVYVKNDLAVRANARVDGLSGMRIPLQMLLEDPDGKMQVVASRELQSRQDGQPIPIELHTRPQTPGEFLLTLRAEPQPGELVTTNNEVSTFITVLKGGINVLYMEAGMRVEQMRLRRSLDASADIKVDFIGFDPRDPKQRPADLAARLRRDKYDVFVLGDVDASFFTPAELASLAEAVSQGAGLVMIGGFHTYEPGGYAETPLADLLPFTMDRFKRQLLRDPPRKDVHLPGPLAMRPTSPIGQRHYLMTLTDGESSAPVWSKLPPLEGANRFGTPKPAAQVLAESNAGEPLLVVQEVNGRVLTFAGDSTWHWWMEGFQNAHKQFWRQVILWAAHKEEMSDGDVWVKLAQRRFAPRDRVEFTAGVKENSEVPIELSRLRAEVVLPDGNSQRVNLARQADHVSGVFEQTQAAGKYAIRITADAPGAPSASAQARFLVFEQDLELDNAVADPTLLASLSAMTKDAGGAALAPEELTDLLQRIQKQPLEAEIEAVVKHTPWDTWPFFLLFVGLISVEWYLRKRWGLV